MTENTLSLFDSEADLDVICLGPANNDSDLSELFPDLDDLHKNVGLSAGLSAGHPQNCHIDHQEGFDDDLISYFMKEGKENMDKDKGLVVTKSGIGRRGLLKRKFRPDSPDSGSSGDTSPQSPAKRGHLQIKKEPSGRCMTKNAVAARQNRQKKKQHIGTLEHDVSTLRHKNETLEEQVKQMQQTMNALNSEVRYLKGVIANQSTLGALLKNIQSTPGVSFSSACQLPIQECQEAPQNPEVMKNDHPAVKNHDEVHGSKCDKTCKKQNARTDNLDHDYASVPSKAEGVEPGGICLHVSGKLVSLEFCATCSQNAHSASSVL